MTTRRAFTAAFGVASLGLALPRAFAQGAYPSRPIQLVVGFPSGQASDVGARVIALKTGEELRQTIYVDNKIGASGIIAHQFVKNAPADGYTLLYGSTGTLAINPALYRKLPYDPIADFAPVVLLNVSPMFLTTATDTPVNNFEDMLAYVKANPGKLSYGSSGNGVTQHIAMEMLKREAGIDMAHIPYKGSPPMITDLIAGRVQFAFETSTAVLPHVKSGRLKLLAISSKERLPALPELPTIAEQGLPGFEAQTWAGMLVPAGTPPAVIEQLNAAVNRALKSKEVVAHFAKSEAWVRGGSAMEFAQFLRTENAKWGKAVIASGAQID